MNPALRIESTHDRQTPAGTAAAGVFRMTATTSTHGYQPRRGSDAWRASVELLSSMRFAIALLTVICIASVIGTVIKQH